MPANRAYQSKGFRPVRALEQADNDEKFCDKPSLSRSLEFKKMRVTQEVE